MDGICDQFFAHLWVSSESCSYFFFHCSRLRVSVTTWCTQDSEHIASILIFDIKKKPFSKRCKCANESTEYDSTYSLAVFHEWALNHLQQASDIKNNKGSSFENKSPRFLLPASSSSDYQIITRYNTLRCLSNFLMQYYYVMVNCMCYQLDLKKKI